MVRSSVVYTIAFDLTCLATFHAKSIALYSNSSGFSGGRYGQASDVFNLVQVSVLKQDSSCHVFNIEFEVTLSVDIAKFDETGSFLAAKTAFLPLR